MSAQQLVITLKKHCIDHKVSQYGRVYAADDHTRLNEYGELVSRREWIDVTDWTPAKLASWLGY